MTPQLRIAWAAATDEHLMAILGLIRQASGWLAGKDSDQWQSPWPDETGRDARVRRSLEVGATWIVRAGKQAAATVTAARTPNMVVWRDADCNLADPAVYAQRLIIDRQFAGFGPGAELIDWTGLRGHRKYGAEWIRIDVWSTKQALHEYYMNAGFEPCERCPEPAYPSGALFHKPVSDITEPGTPSFLVFSGGPPELALTAVPRSLREPLWRRGGGPGGAGTGETGGGRG